jgi:hypothetical protein
LEWLERSVEKLYGDKRSHPTEISTESTQASSEGPSMPRETGVTGRKEVESGAVVLGEAIESRLKTAGDRATDPPLKGTEGASTGLQMKLEQVGDVKHGE